MLLNTNIKKFNVAVPEDYPEITKRVKGICKTTINYLFNGYSLIPDRVGASIEGGIAVVYKKRKELFIEIYNDGSVVIMVHYNCKQLRKIGEYEKITEKILDNYVKLFEEN